MDGEVGVNWWVTSANLFYLFDGSLPSLRRTKCMTMYQTISIATYGARALETIDDDHLKAAYELLLAVKDISQGIRRAVASCCSTSLLSRSTLLSVYYWYNRVLFASRVELFLLTRALSLSNKGTVAIFFWYKRGQETQTQSPTWAYHVGLQNHDHDETILSIDSPTSTTPRAHCSSSSLINAVMV